MKPTSIAWNSTRRRWFLVGVVMLVGLFAGYLASDYFLDSPPDRPKPAAQLIRELHEQDTVLDKVWQALWPNIPSVAKKHLARFEPKPAAEVRWEACRALGEMRHEAARVVPALISAVNDSSPDVQRTAIQALGEIGPPAFAAQPELIRILKNRANQTLPRKAEMVCAEAAAALAMISPEDPLVFHLLKEALGDTQTSGASSAVAMAAVSGLEKMAHARQEVASTLISVLPNSDANFRAHILAALGRIRQQPETVVPILIDGLDFKDARVRRIAVEALGNFGSEAAPAVSALIRLAQEERVSRKREAQARRERARGLDSLSDDQLRRYGLLPAVSSASGNITRTLGRIGPGAKEALSFLIEGYSDRENPGRYEEAFACWQIDGDTAAVTPVFLEGISRPANDTQMNVTGRLREMGLEAVPILMTAFRHTDGNVRVAAVATLAEIRPTLLLAPALLQSGLNDPHLSVRLAMIKTLGACGVEAVQAVPLLKPLLNDPKYVIRTMTGEALKNIQPASLSP